MPSGDHSRDKSQTASPPCLKLEARRCDGYRSPQRRHGLSGCQLPSPVTAPPASGRWRRLTYRPLAQVTVNQAPERLHVVGEFCTNARVERRPRPNGRVERAY